VDRRAIALVSCVKSKRAVTSEARHIYASALFVKSRAWAERHCDGWYILSARYGLVSPTARIEPYEQTLKDMSAGERREWARRVFAQMQENRLLLPGTTFVWLAGQSYKRDLASLLAAYAQQDPMEGLPIGKRLQWLTHAPPDWRRQ
jgi:hypothetical protein